MKSILLYGLLFLSAAGQAQTTKEKAKAKKQATAAVQKPAKTSTRSITVSLFSSGNYTARSTPASLSIAERYQIGDPILKAWSARARGTSTPVIRSGIVGMPRSAYGFANGHLFLGTTAATTSGTQTGSGSVGTGTSLGTFGSRGPELNGKSPYAGSSMWGNARNLPVNGNDSTAKKN